MALVSSSPHQGWTVDLDRRLPGLEVVLLKQTYVLPWSQFLYAEGSADQMRAVFSTHDLVITGSGLASLLSDFAAQHITRLQEPARTEKFTPSSSSRIVMLTVTLVESGER